MPTKTSVADVVSPEQTTGGPEANSTKTVSQYTKWEVFDKAGLRPTNIRCDVLPGHQADESCKTNLIPNAANIVRHIENEHGGGFKFTLKEVEPRTKKSDPPAWQGWTDLHEAGAEIQSIRCEVCDHYVNQSVRDIRTHLKPHKGKFRGAYQSFRNQLLFNISFTAPSAVGDDDDESYNQ